MRYEDLLITFERVGEEWFVAAAVWQNGEQFVGDFSTVCLRCNREGTSGAAAATYLFTLLSSCPFVKPDTNVECAKETSLDGLVWRHMLISDAWSDHGVEV